MRVSLLSCGRCGKPRGIVHHCTSRRKGPAFKAGLAFTCGTCGKAIANPLSHECVVPSDFRKRKAAEARARKTGERRRKRKEAAARRRARAKARKAEAAKRRKQAERDRREQQKAQDPARSHDRERHDYQGCDDELCSRYPCRVYREGKDNGRVEGHAEGYAAGYADGVQAGIEGGNWR